MPRYFTRAAKAFYVEDDCWRSGNSGHVPSVPDHEATDTGLLDAKGEPIWRAPNPMGFGKDEEW